jgi:hypothetical protein
MRSEEAFQYVIQETGVGVYKNVFQQQLESKYWYAGSKFS